MFHIQPFYRWRWSISLCILPIPHPHTLAPSISISTLWWASCYWRRSGTRSADLYLSVFDEDTWGYVDIHPVFPTFGAETKVLYPKDRWNKGKGETQLLSNILTTLYSSCFGNKDIKAEYFVNINVVNDFSGCGLYQSSDGSLYTSPKTWNSSLPVS